jgi:BASS family bile acid:Na+ symporter
MLIPLAIGLSIRAGYVHIAKSLQPYLTQVSTLALILLIASGLLANVNAVLGVFASGGIITLLLFLGLAFIFGYLLGGNNDAIRSVLALGTAQRNLSAALVIATTNFAAQADVIAMVLVLGLVDLSSLLIAANLLRRRYGNLNV